MMLASDGSDDAWYDFVGSAQFLLGSVDVYDEPLLVRRAIELQAFLISLFYPRRYGLTAAGKVRLPRVDMIGLGRKYAALELYTFYTFFKYRPRLGNKLPSRVTVQNNLSVNFRRIEPIIDILKEYLSVKRNALSATQIDISDFEFKEELQRQFEKSKSVAILIDAYLTNGDDLPKTSGRPVGIKIMRQALCRSKLLRMSDRTLFNYYNELELTSVFHYLIWNQDCKILRPLDPGDPKFTQIIMRRATLIDEFRAVCQLYNTVALKLNEKYLFAFSTIDNLPKPANTTDYDLLASDKSKPKLTEAIKAAIDRTE